MIVSMADGNGNRETRDDSPQGAIGGPVRAQRPARSRGPAKLVLDLFSNVWFGVGLLVLLFVYCSIGSAIPAVREHPTLELTEFEWFHWWPFNVLILLTGITLSVVTIRRIPLRAVNAGVWMIHTGIIVLLAGSYYYFTTKVEGDTPVFRRHVRIELPGLQEPKTLPVFPGNELQVTAGPDLWSFLIQDTNSQWPILSDEDKGKTAYAVNVLVSPPGGAKFVRQLLAGYPQYTEDVIPGKGRAIKNTGRKLVDENVKLSLELEPQDSFHLMKSWALYVRRAGERDWVERPMEGMPRYHDRIGSREQVFFDPHFPVELRPIDLPIPPGPQGDALGHTSVRVTGYLRYARLERKWREGTEGLNPVLRISAATAHSAPQSYELVAFDPVRRRVESGTVEFVWMDDPAKVATLPSDSRALLQVTVPLTQGKFEVPLTADVVVGREGPFTPIEGTDLSYRVVNVVDDLAMPDGRRPVSIAMVEVQAPEGRFTRMVADQAESTRDIHGDGDPHGGGRRAEQIDPRIHMTYKPRSAPVLFAAHPNGLYLSVNGQGGRTLGREIQVGENIEVVPGLTIRADALWRRAVPELKPFIVPPPSRDRGMEENMSMVRLEVASGGAIQSEWLPFNQYALPSVQYAFPGRMVYAPVMFRLADGTRVEVLFSRQRMRLPKPVAMEDFELDTHVGGYSGSVSTIRNYVSRLRFFDGSAWSEPTPTAVNQPTHSGGLWFFQSSWDRPPADNPSGGMNYTGLGVGNREGVYIQLGGCCLSVAGMLFAFYVKPVLKRNRRNQSVAKSMLQDGRHERGHDSDSDEEDRETKDPSLEESGPSPFPMHPSRPQ